MWLRGILNPIIYQRNLLGFPGPLTFFVSVAISLLISFWDLLISLSKEMVSQRVAFEGNKTQACDFFLLHIFTTTAFSCAFSLLR